MRIGISTASYFSKRYTEEAFEEIAKIGAPVCEVFLASHCEYTQEFGKILVDKINQARKISPLEIHSMHTLTNQFEPELFSIGDRAKSDAFKIFRNALSVGQIIGAKHYTFHGATILKRAVKYNFDYEKLGELTNKCVEVAAEYGIKFCYENVHWTYFHKPEYFEKLKPYCPDLGCVLDIKQAKQSGISWKEYLEVMKDRLCTVHLCDYKDSGELTIPGRGDFDFVEFFKYLLDSGYNGPCLMEVYGKNYKEMSELEESYHYLLDCLDKAKH